MANAATWRERVEEWRASGLKAKAFAEARGVSAHQLWNWAATFRKESQAKVADRPAPTMVQSKVPEAETTGASSVRLARVVRAPTRDSALQSPSLSVEFSEVRIVVPDGFDRSTFAMVLDAIERRKAQPER